MPKKLHLYKTAEIVERDLVVRDGEKLGPSGYRTRSWRIA